MPNDVADWTSKTSAVIDTSGGAVSVAQSGPVSITGTVNVSIQGTPAVTISGTPTVSISGNVTFSNTQIQVLNVAGNLLNTNQVPTSLGNWAVAGIAGTVVSQTVTVPTAAHAIQVACNVDCAIAIRGTTTQCYYSKNPFASVSTNVGRQGATTTFEIPINTGIETGYEIRITKADGTAGTAWAAAVLSTESVTAKTDIGDPLRVASRIDVSQTVERGGAVSLNSGFWTTLLTSALGITQQIQSIQLSAVNGSGVSQTFRWRYIGSISLVSVEFHSVVFFTQDYHQLIRYDPHLFWGRSNQLAWNGSDAAIFQCFVNAANCLSDIVVTYLLG